MSDIALSGIFLFIIMVGLPYTLLLNAVGLAGGLKLRIMLAMMQIFDDINLNSITFGYEKSL